MKQCTYNTGCYIEKIGGFHYEGVCESESKPCPYYEEVEKETKERSPVERRVMPPLLAEILKTFPLVEPDRIVEGPNGETLAEWWAYGYYFEIEHTPEGELEIMTKNDIGEIKHWVLKGA